ncbi:hypothetical protein ACF3MZ_07105 [Paenibacillaceae bacterium WGS1546]|uniref:hypothetical protein n=1 Tax=Cohnella sp. WGS1546 TaxID=3366810 RepID=UPI00372D0437
MEGELGSGARIAIALIVIGVIISVIFVILGFTRGTTNQGITTVQNSMDSMSLAQFEDYDQKILSGTQVISAIKLFEGRPVAAIVRTTSSMGITDGSAPSDDRAGHNYGALLDEVSRNGNSAPITGMERENNNSFYTHDLKVDDNGNMEFNSVYLPLTRSGTPTFVRPTAKFLAELIKDTTGTIVGVCFTQQL